MAKVTIIYGSTTGSTEKVAKLIAKQLGDQVSAILDIKDATTDDFNKAEVLFLGTSTWDEGELQEDWVSFEGELDSVDFSGKKVALFGTGDQIGYADHFVGGLIKLYDRAKQGGAEIVGLWPTEGYEFDHSEALVDGKFAGLAIDEDNQSSETEPRVKAWVSQVLAEL